jgi:hypothetical protein
MPSDVTPILKDIVNTMIWKQQGFEYHYVISNCLDPIYGQNRKSPINKENFSIDISSGSTGMNPSI